MAKAIKIDGKTYRMRRGKLVEIPEKWVGNCTTKKTIRQRPSKQIHKLRKFMKYGERRSLKEPSLEEG